MIQPGAFVVSRWDKDPKQILFQTKTDVSATPEQLDLKSQIEQTLTALQMIFEGNEKMYFSYFAPLLSLAQAGLVGPAAQPNVAKMALDSLKADVLAREAGRVKNRYMKSLGGQALCFAIVVSILGSVSHFFLSINPLSAFCALWVGCMGGVWVSFGIRKTLMSFQDLSIPDDDRLEPSIRLIFAGILTIFLGFAFMKGAIVIEIASLKSVEIATDFITSCIFGFACGVSELTLPTKVSQQAARFLDFK